MPDAFCKSAAAKEDLPDDGWPKSSICFAGIVREDETESRIDDHKFSGGASGLDGREDSMDADELVKGGRRSRSNVVGDLRRSRRSTF